MTPPGHRRRTQVATLDRPEAPSCCPQFHRAVELVGKRWTGAILYVLIESGRPMRFMGAEAAIWSPKAARVAAIIFDSNGPGAMALTVMSGARCLARWRVSWCTAAFDDEYE